MIGHARFRELAAAAIDFELTALEARNLKRHLADCPTCRHAADGLRSDAGRLAAMPLRDAPAQLGLRIATRARAGIRPQRTRWVLVLVAAVLALLLVVLGGAAVGALLRLRDEMTERQATPMPTLASFPAQGQATLPAKPLTWTRSATFGDADMGAAVAFSGGFAVFGQDRVSQAPVEWRSADGTTWRRVALSPDTFGGSPRDVAAGGPGLVAIGWDVGLSAGVHRVVWTSKDGETWARDPRPDGDLGPVRIDGLVAGGPGFLAWGADPTGVSPVVREWFSADGLSWAVADGLGSVLGGAPTGILGFDGGFVAWAMPGSGAQGTVAWSHDGQSWSSLILTGLPTDGSLSGVAIGAGGPLIARSVPGNGNGTLALSASADGARWSTVTAPTLDPNADPGSIRFLGTPVGTFAFAAQGNGDSGPIAWHRSSAGDWITETGLTGDASGTLRPRLSAVGGRAIVVLGQSADGTAWSAWTGDLP